MYNMPEEDVAVNAVIKDETIWLTQKAMSDLFGVEVPAISKHLSNIFLEGELEAEATISKMEIVREEGKRNVKRAIDFYNLAKDKGFDVKLVEAKDAPHIDLDMTSESKDAIEELVGE